MSYVQTYPDAVARHATIVDAKLEVLYAGAARAGKRHEAAGLA